MLWLEDCALAALLDAEPPKPGKPPAPKFWLLKKIFQIRLKNDHSTSDWKEKVVNYCEAAFAELELWLPPKLGPPYGPIDIALKIHELCLYLITDNMDYAYRSTCLDIDYRMDYHRIVLKNKNTFNNCAYYIYIEIHFTKSHLFSMTIGTSWSKQ